MAKKKTDKYKAGYVSKRILDKVDKLVNPNDPMRWNDEVVYEYSKMHQTTNTFQRAAMKEYERLNLDFFYSKEDMIYDLAYTNKDFWRTHDPDEFWAQYLRRDVLIRSGKYEKALQMIYQENYIEQANRFLGEDNEALNEIKTNLERLSPEQFDRLTHPTDRNSTTTALPPIQEFYMVAFVQAQGETSAAEFKDRFKKAFAEAGISWEEPEPANELELTEEEENFLIDSDKQSYRRHINYEYKKYVKYVTKTIPNDKYGRTYKQQLYFATREERERLNDYQPDVSDTIKARREALAALKRREERLLSKGRALVFISKAGKYYIPGVSREVTEDYLKTYYGK